MLREDPRLASLAGMGYRVYWEGEGRSRKLLLANTRYLVGRPLPDDRRRTVEDIVRTLDLLIRHLEILA